MAEGELFAVRPDAAWRWVPNTYEGIKEGLDGATLDLVQLSAAVGLFVDDNGMIDGLALNVPASMFASMALYGPVVLCGGADEEGETQPAIPDAVELLQSLVAMWTAVEVDGARKGQRLHVHADPDAIPPPQIIALTDDEFARWLEGR